MLNEEDNLRTEFLHFKEVTGLRSLTDQGDNRANTSVTTHDKEYHLCRVEADRDGWKSLNRQLQPPTISKCKPQGRGGGGEESDFQSYHVMILKMLSTKHYKACEETGKYGPSPINSFICLFTRFIGSQVTYHHTLTHSPVSSIYPTYSTNEWSPPSDPGLNHRVVFSVTPPSFQIHSFRPPSSWN